MAWLYFSVCLFDFLVAPILYVMVQTDHIDKIQALMQWTPLTLKGGGLFHLAMGAIVGVTAWSRGQEKREMIAASYMGDVQSTYESTYTNVTPTKRSEQ